VALLLVWMIGGPVYRQVFNGSNKLFPAWHMYRGWGAGVWAVRLEDRGAPVDRLAVLGYGDWRTAPLAVKRIRSARELEQQLKAICEALGPEADLRVTASVGRVDGFEAVPRPRYRGEKDVCP
jgi:hypothetical protein